jgi:hypothetical protein
MPHIVWQATHDSQPPIAPTWHKTSYGCSYQGWQQDGLAQLQQQRKRLQHCCCCTTASPRCCGCCCNDVWQYEGHGEYAEYIAADCQQQRKRHIAAQLLQHNTNGSSSSTSNRRD